jgi:hypothetical protein
MTKQEYLDRAELAARLVAQEQARRFAKPAVEGLPDTAGVPKDAVLISEGERVANALRYAEWRWEGFHAVPREIESL